MASHITLAAGRDRWVPIVAVLGAAACWGVQGIVYALILDQIETDGLTVVTLRAGTATLLLWIWLGLTNPGALRIPRAALPGFAVLGLIAVTLFYPALFYTYAWTSVAVGTVLLYLSPALVALGAAVFLGEPLTRRKLIALATTFIGCILVVQAYQPANVTGSAAGIGMGLIAAATYGTYSVLGKKLLARYSIAMVLAGYLLCGTLLLIGVKLLVSPTTWPAPREAIMIGLVTGVLATLAPITLYTYGLSRLPASEASILLTVEPVVAFVLAAAVLGETFAGGQWLGAISLLAGVVLLTVPAHVSLRPGGAHRWLGHRLGAIIVAQRFQAETGESVASLAGLIGIRRRADRNRFSGP
jgi:drug/metabolite transporter (DMT)-like permease